jgi:hypothetical protein
MGGNGNQQQGKITNEQAPAEEPSLATEVEKFLHQIDGLATSMPLVMIMMHASQIAADEKLLDFLETNCELLSTVDNEKTFKVLGIHLREAARLKRNTLHARVGIQILPRCFLVSLVSAYDYFLGRILYCLFSLRSELMNVSEKELKYGQLMQFSSMPEAVRNNNRGAFS